MCSMCHYCGAETKLKEGKDNGDSLRLHGKGTTWTCRICQEKQEKELLKRDAISSASPMISPTTSLSSIDRSVSSCSDVSVDVNSYDRYNGSLDCTREDLSYEAKGRFHSPSLDVMPNVFEHKGMENNLKESHDSSSRGEGNVMRDVEITETINHLEQQDDVSEGNIGSLNGENGISHSGDDEIDAQFWEVPEADDLEDDLEGSVAFNDDDDDEECGDGTKWGKPSSLSCCKDGANGSYRFKEEKQKAIEEVINGKFKVVVSQLLKTAGVPVGKDTESWVDIITSLSWEAASFLKPEAIDGKAMDPDGYVKVKCIATGSRSESQVIKGLVFKKHAAHKHMPTKYKNPRLLLIRGVLGHSSSGLSSFKSMDQEKDNLKSLMEMIETCHPNVVLVEKSVSRDVQESILAKGMTLVYDMKLHRLERVSRCTGAPILSSDALMNQKLKQCDSFHIEKFVEEHAGLSEGGKRPSKTLMFVEGCPTRLGCTILLKGSHSDELKRVKQVVQITVVMAYHLILETSFLVDQKTMLSTVLFAGVVNSSPSDQQPPILENGNFTASTIETEPSALEIPISNGSHEEVSDELNVGLEGDSALSYVPYNPVVFSGLSSISTSLKKVMGEHLQFVSSAPYRSLSSFFSFNTTERNGQTEEIPILKAVEDGDHCHTETKSISGNEKSLDEEHTESLTCGSEVPPERQKDFDSNEDQVQNKNNVNALLDCQSILVLMSSRNALQGTICQQSHFSHIMFYRNFDVPLGKFLRDNLLNQKTQCASCGAPPEAHFYYYAHRNKQLTVQVRRLLKPLPGEVDGKLWMWSRCGKCKNQNGAPKSTKRVLISTAACSLSFGKFLELSFSHHSSSRASSCGHSLEQDFLYFFGSGPMAAMFKYSPVTTYTVSLPPPRLQFSHSIRIDGLKKQCGDVYSKGILLFSSIADMLKKLRPQFVGSRLNLHGSLKEFSDIEDMLKHEISEFELSFQNAVAKHGSSDDADYKILSLNRLLWELLLQSYIWEQRLHSLLSNDPSVVVTGATEKAGQTQLKSKMNGPIDGRNEGVEIVMENGDKFSDNGSYMPGRIYTSAEGSSFSTEDIPIDSSIHESAEQDNFNNRPLMSEDIHSDGLSKKGLLNQDMHVKTESSIQFQLDSDNSVEDNFALLGDLHVERPIPVAADSRSGSFGDSYASRAGTSLGSQVLSLENSIGWFWMPFPEIRQIYIKDLQRGFVPKFPSISSHVQEQISAVHQLITEEGPRLHIPVGNGNFFIRDYDGELSSIIACALAFLQDIPDVFYENFRKEGSVSGKSTEGLHVLAQFPSITSSQWSSPGSDSDSVHSTLSISSEESRFSSFDGLNLLESLVPPENLSPEVSMGFVKSLGKGKYSVICLYSKQFRDLRNRCCPSEVDYIASLSRCKDWDAKGGKSKSFFAKTLDDRFIIKEIKKTEFESFVKFAPHYFKYMNESFELGNQTCLAKVLGIYQVIVRQAKSGKETRHDLMVMENLTFGRNVTRQYDLKGALHARFNSASDGSGDVLLDQNFVNDMNNSPLYVSHKAKYLLERAVWNDTTFLNSINVMDYSLLVVVDTHRQELVCGIIDYLRQYTWDKQLETWVKSSLVVPRNVLPTVISPREYKKRFRKFMGTHFLSVPDSWCAHKCSNTGSCELCGIHRSSQ